MSKDYNHEPCMSASFVRTDMARTDLNLTYSLGFELSPFNELGFGLRASNRENAHWCLVEQEWFKNTSIISKMLRLSRYPTRRVFPATNVYWERLQKSDVSQSNDRKRFWTLDMKGRSSCLYERAASSMNSLTAWMNSHNWISCDPDMGILLSDY